MEGKKEERMEWKEEKERGKIECGGKSKWVEEQRRK